MTDDFKLAQKVLLLERDREVKKTFGFGRKEITEQIICDLYSLPGSGGSDERGYALQWLERSGSLFNSYEDWQQIENVFASFLNPTILEMENITNDIRSRTTGRNR